MKTYSSSSWLVVLLGTVPFACSGNSGGPNDGSPDDSEKAVDTDPSSGKQNDDDKDVDKEDSDESVVAHRDLQLIDGNGSYGTDTIGYRNRSVAQGAKQALTGDPGYVGFGGAFAFSTSPLTFD